MVGQVCRLSDVVHMYELQYGKILELEKNFCCKYCDLIEKRYIFCIMIFDMDIVRFLYYWMGILVFCIF